ncbi:MAG: hypothetical protein B6244_07380 [Candidatus Cloacimonetes bacterium 4572_55]|nr:MAG: hypothetical protein B6244_07380 [Candidatus Cloacimonetes bacterium 4572_55]
MESKKRKLGIWVIGAKGGVSTTMITGVLAIVNNHSSAAGLVTDRPEFSKMDLVSLENLAFGGYDIRGESLYENACRINKGTGTLGEIRLMNLKEELDRVDQDIKPGISINCGKSINELVDTDLPKNELHLRQVIKSIQEDVQAFIKTKELDSLVMLNLASTEPYNPLHFDSEASRTLAGLENAIDQNQGDMISTSTLYAYAAIDMGHPYMNFTPSVGSSTQAMQELALERGVPHMGKDGKTGETMVKSTLAVMFPIRNMKVLSWAGFNILGDRDGEILANPENKATKIRSKDAALRSILGQDPFAYTAIEYVPSLDDWKTAWDHIHFQGFLDTKMVMQFTWQGCDAILAAPLAIDMVLLADFAKQKGERGLMPHTSVFFKSPINVDEHALGKQFSMLEEYVARHSSDL